MSKKSNPDKGLRTVSIEFGGKTRTLKFGHTAIGDLEGEANQVLRAQRTIEPGNMVFADGIMQTWIGNAKIFGLTLKYGLLADAASDPENAVKDVNAAIDEYIESGKSKLELTRAIVTAYRMATDPSSVASLTRSWKILDERQEALTKAENEFMDQQEKILAESKAKLTPGSQSTALPESS